MEDTNLNYDSCKNCDKLEAEICRLKIIWETERGDNNRLKKERDNISEHNREIIKDLQETREQLFNKDKSYDKLYEDFTTLCRTNVVFRDENKRYKDEYEQQLAISKAWETVAKKIEKENKRLIGAIKASNINGLPIDLNEQ